MDIIANISVRDISKVGFAQIASSPTFFNIFAWNFQDASKSAFRTYVRERIFDLGLRKNLDARSKVALASALVTDIDDVHVDYE